MGCHSTADDSQVGGLETVRACLYHVKDWLSLKVLNFNENKSEIKIIFYSKITLEI